MDMWGMLHTVSRADFIRSTIKTLEKYMNLAFEQSVKHGPEARQFVVLFDMAGFNVKQYTWRPGELNTIVNFIVIFMILQIVMHNYLHTFYYNI